MPQPPKKPARRRKSYTRPAGMADDADDFKPRKRTGGLNRGRYNNTMKQKARKR